MPIKELTEPRIIKNLQRIKKKLYAELSVLEINFIDTDETEEFDNSNLELEIDQLHQMIRSIDKAIHLIKKGPGVATRAMLDEKLSEISNSYLGPPEFTPDFLASMNDKDPDKSHSLVSDEISNSRPAPLEISGVKGPIIDDPDYWEEKTDYWPG